MTMQPTVQTNGLRCPGRLDRTVDYYETHYFEHFFQRISEVRTYLYIAVICRLYSRFYEPDDILAPRDH
jgi:hypothetical protein